MRLQGEMKLLYRPGCLPKHLIQHPSMPTQQPLRYLVGGYRSPPGALELCVKETEVIICSLEIRKRIIGYHVNFVELAISTVEDAFPGHQYLLGMDVRFTLVLFSVIGNECEVDVLLLELVELCSPERGVNIAQLFDREDRDDRERRSSESRWGGGP